MNGASSPISQRQAGSTSLKEEVAISEDFLRSLRSVTSWSSIALNSKNLKDCLTALDQGFFRNAQCIERIEIDFNHFTSEEDVKSAIEFLANWSYSDIKAIKLNSGVLGSNQVVLNFDKNGRFQNLRKIELLGGFTILNIQTPKNCHLEHLYIDSVGELKLNVVNSVIALLEITDSSKTSMYCNQSGGHSSIQIMKIGEVKGATELLTENPIEEETITINELKIGKIVWCGSCTMYIPAKSIIVENLEGQFLCAPIIKCKVQSDDFGNIVQGNNLFATIWNESEASRNPNWKKVSNAIESIEIKSRSQEHSLRLLQSLEKKVVQEMGRNLNILFEDDPVAQSQITQRRTIKNPVPIVDTNRKLEVKAVPSIRWSILAKVALISLPVLMILFWMLRSFSKE